MFDVWFRVDARPFKQALLTIIKRWSFMFKQHLIDHVTNRWVQLYSFSFVGLNYVIGIFEKLLIARMFDVGIKSLCMCLSTTVRTRAL